jgi:hypothetical protein
MQTRQSVVLLSRDSRWKPLPYEPPYLLADAGSPWPTGSSATAVFTDTSGGELATFDLDVTPDAILPDVDQADVNTIPHGANFEIFLEDSTGTDKIRYGKVNRREVQFFDAPAVQQASIALNYTDTFPTLGLRTNWKAVKGSTKVYDNTSASLPNGVSANAGLFVAQSAIRWDSPLNTDTVKSHVVLLNKGSGKCTAIISADQRFSTGLGVQFDSAANQIHLGIVTGPTAMTYQASAVSHTVVNLEDFYVTYDLPTKTLAVYQGTNLTPLQTWVDSGNLVAHGPGYRYAGFAFDTGVLFSPGIEISGWQAKDN